MIPNSFSGSWCAKIRARVEVTVDFPTPPFPDSTKI